MYANYSLHVAISVDNVDVNVDPVFVLSLTSCVRGKIVLKELCMISYSASCC